MYGKKASELVKEFANSEPGQLVAFNNDLFSQVIEECNGHFFHLQASLVRKMQNERPGSQTNGNTDHSPDDEASGSADHSSDSQTVGNADRRSDGQTAATADHFGALIHHLSLVRNKRCLMAYVYNRAEVVRSLGWMIERVLPEDIEEKLNNSEKEYFKNHSATLQSYMSELDLDLAVDMVPPKDPYIKVRVLDDIGNVVLSDQQANLAHHAILFLRRTDAEQYISQGLMEELIA